MPAARQIGVSTLEMIQPVHAPSTRMRNSCDTKSGFIVCATDPKQALPASSPRSLLIDKTGKISIHVAAFVREISAMCSELVRAALPESVGHVQEITARMGRSPGRVLVIDAGGVLFNNVIENSPFLELIAVRFGVASNALRCGYDALSGALETGKLGIPAAFDACLGDLNAPPLSVEDRRFIDQAYISSVRINSALVDELIKLRAAGRTIVLANNEAHRWEILKHKRFRHLKIFNTIASSWRLGAAKPEKKYFSRLQELLAPAGPSTWWFVDDNTENIAQASQFGIPSSLFRGW